MPHSRRPSRWEMDAFGSDLPGGNGFLPMDQEGPKEHLTGKMYDTETGLYYFHARWYDPQVGRFVSRDPVVFARCGASLALRAYPLAGGSPVNYIDPTGKYVEIDTATCNEGERTNIFFAIENIRRNVYAWQGVTAFCAQVRGCSWRIPVRFEPDAKCYDLCECYRRLLDDSKGSESKDAVPFGLKVKCHDEESDSDCKLPECTIRLWRIDVNYGVVLIGPPEDREWDYRPLAGTIVHEMTHCCRGAHPRQKIGESKKAYVNRLEKIECDAYWVESKYEGSADK